MVAVYATPESELSLSLLAGNEGQPVRRERITDRAVMRYVAVLVVIRIQEYTVCGVLS